MKFLFYISLLVTIFTIPSKITIQLHKNYKSDFNQVLKLSFDKFRNKKI